MSDVIGPLEMITSDKAILSIFKRWHAALLSDAEDAIAGKSWWRPGEAMAVSVWSMAGDALEKRALDSDAQGRS